MTKSTRSDQNDHFFKAVKGPKPPFLLGIRTFPALELEKANYSRFSGGGVESGVARKSTFDRFSRKSLALLQEPGFSRFRKANKSTKSSEK